MKKTLWTLIAIAILATLILNGLVLREVTWLAEENEILRSELKQGLKAAKTENLAQIKSVGDELKEQLAENQNEIEVNLENQKIRLVELESKTFEPDKIYEKNKGAIVQVLGATGFLYQKNNLVVTAYHVIKNYVNDDYAPEKGKIPIFTNDSNNPLIMGKMYKTRPEWDLAVIKLQKPLNAEPLSPEISLPVLGEQVMVTGHTSGYRNSISTGVISGVGRNLDVIPAVKFIQTDASVFFGNSGSPIFNGRSKVIGVITNRVDISGFAVPIEYVEKLLAQQ